MQNQNKHTYRGCKIKTNSNIEGVIGCLFGSSWKARHNALMEEANPNDT